MYRQNLFITIIAQDRSQIKVLISQYDINENRVSRLFLRGGSRASKKSKSTDFGFFLYLLAKTAFYWLFSQNNSGLIESLFYYLLTFALVRFSQWNKAGKEKSTKVAFESKQSGNPILLLEKFFRCFGCEMRKSVLGDMERYKKFLKKFESGPSTFQENCPWYSEGKIFLKNFRPWINIFLKTVLGYM